MTRIGYAGLSHLGLISSVAAAARGFDVVAYDADANLVARINGGDLPVVEPGLPELLGANRSRLRFTANAADLAACDAVYIARDVPTDGRGASDLAPVHALLNEVAPILRADALLVVLCQVPPGFTRSLRRPAATTFYQVETLVFGRAVDRAVNPERFIVGCADPSVPLPAALTAFLGAFGCPILPMRYESAELTKIAINVCLVASIGVANTLSDLSEAIGADWSEIAPALHLDKRIGPHAYLAPGLGLSGGNLERDLATVINLSDAHGAEAGLIRAAVADSSYRRGWVLRALRRELGSLQRPRIAVLGLAYKEDTASIKNSPAIELIHDLDGGAELVAYDPVVPDESAPRMIRRVEQALTACEDVDAVAVMTPWAEFRTLGAKDVMSRMRGRLVLDPLRVLDAAAFRAAGANLYSIGLGDTPAC